MNSPRSFVITFDDGYVDNLLNAKPLLELYQTQATIFVVSGNLNGGREFWWDELEYLFLTPGELPEVLEIEVNGSLRRFELGDWATYKLDSYKQHGNWKTWQNPPTTRHSLFYSVWEILHGSSETERNQVLSQLFSWARIEPRVRLENAILNSNQLRLMKESNFIEIGCHTVTHQRLSELPVDGQREELRRCKKDIEQVVGIPVTSFAYPFGAPGDFSDETAKLVREIGFDCACSTIPGLVENDSDLYQLPRMYVGDWSGEEFREQLDGWFKTESLSLL